MTELIILFSLFLIALYFLSAYFGCAVILRKIKGSIITGVFIFLLILLGVKLRTTDDTIFKQFFLEISNFLLIIIGGGILSGALYGWSRLKK